MSLAIQEVPVEAPRARAEPGVVPDHLRVAGRTVWLSPVFETYWRFAAERQATYLRRLAGGTGPWTADPVLRAHRFTNCYRASDRVSQYLIRHVIYDGDSSAEEVVFRILLFKIFNKVETWQALRSALGELRWRSFDAERYAGVLARVVAGGRAVYSAAYVMPSPRMGYERKYRNHLALLDRMMRDGVALKLERSASMREAFQILRSYQGLGDFLAFQYLIDINYSEVLDFDEMSFVVAGPGARSGLRKVFGAAAVGIELPLIKLMAEEQSRYFDALGLRFDGLVGRPLQLIDCQNLFCEVDKYSRVVHPLVAGGTNRHRIKQRYAPAPTRPEQALFPPKWNTRVPVLDFDV
jgi:hypothetical protein